MFDFRHIFRDIFDKDSEESDDDKFVRNLQSYWSDLGYVRKLIKIPISKRTDLENKTIDYFKEKYKPNGDCPSFLYEYVSKELQANYWGIHNHICSFLY